MAARGASRRHGSGCVAAARIGAGLRHGTGRRGGGEALCSAVPLAPREEEERENFFLQSTIFIFI